MSNIDSQIPSDISFFPFAGRRKAVWGGRIALALFAMLVLLAAASCSDTVRSGQGSSYLVITSVSGPNGTPVQSDVVSDDGAVFADAGSASLQLQMKDVLSSPSPNNSITLTQYHVEYVRSDGHNIQGVDVPYAFDGGMTLTVGTSEVSGVFTIVRNIAKDEAPLRALTVNGVIISTIAEVTFYGHDQTGREVSAVATISVDFGNFGDKTS